ncbi:hypothetical protein NLG97_g10349 [Lecanicillium saksenae]|uniref:Uncharacterized protein n=1 Tax=Lecanicillium saksenae TaxID=468837 RepID=A0ACC1QDP6_9HYPO|nr:hypothetical protein NLG97_g10349 [Lecanicillium saksenae]
MRLSGLQKEVLGLYRHCLRESRNKPEVSAMPPMPYAVQPLGPVSATRPHFQAFARSEFAKNLAIDKRDFAAIEFLLRKGKRQLEVYSSPGIKDIR